MAGHNRKGNLKGNTQSTRNSIPAEERVELKQKIIDAKIKGASFYEIADRYNIAWETAKKLFWEALAEAGDSEDPSLVLRKERMRLEQIVDKVTRDYHANKCRVGEVIAASAHYNKYNGCDRYIDTVTPAKLPPLITIEVTNIPVEMPPKSIQTTTGK